MKGHTLEEHHRNFLADGSDSLLVEGDSEQVEEEDSGELLHWLPAGLSMVLSTRNSWRESLMQILVEPTIEGWALPGSVAAGSMSEVVVRLRMEVSPHPETSTAGSASVVFGDLRKQLGPETSM